METITTYQVKETTWPSKTFVTQREKVPFDKLASFFGQHYENIFKYIGTTNLKMVGAPCAIYHSVDEVNKITDVSAAVAVSGEVAKVEGFTVVTLPTSRVLTTTHHGSYESMTPAYEALEQYLKDHRLEKSLIVEEYVTAPDVESDPSKQKTNIFFVLKK